MYGFEGQLYPSSVLAEQYYYFGFLFRFIHSNNKVSRKHPTNHCLLHRKNPNHWRFRSTYFGSIDGPVPQTSDGWLWRDGVLGTTVHHPNKTHPIPTDRYVWQTIHHVSKNRWIQESHFSSENRCERKSSNGCIWPNNNGPGVCDSRSSNCWTTHRQIWKPHPVSQNRWVWNTPVESSGHRCLWSASLFKQHPDPSAL